MSDFYYGEIRAFAFNYAPDGWLPCNGQALPINQYQVLYSIIGNLYGTPPNQNSFLLPNLNASTNNAVGIPLVGAGQGPGLSPYTAGQKTGVASITPDLMHLPAHSHSINAIIADTSATYSAPTATSQLARYLSSGTNKTQLAYSSQALPSTPSYLNAAALTATGVTQSQPYDNRQPYLAFTFAIAVQGDVYPIRP